VNAPFLIAPLAVALCTVSASDCDVYGNVLRSNPHTNQCICLVLHAVQHTGADGEGAANTAIEMVHTNGGLMDTAETKVIAYQYMYILHSHLTHVTQVPMY
jgi:hypothetical protein